MEIYDFIPKYPNVEKQEPSFMNPYNTNFYTSLYRKKEFYDNKLSATEPIPQNPGEFMKAQKTIAHYFNSITVYDKLLLLWTPGTGKSLAAIAAIEKIKYQNSSINKALIFAKGGGLLKNFQNELVFKGTKGTYIPENYDLMTEGEKQSRVKKNVKEYYSFYTFQTFAKELTTKSDDFIKQNFSNKIIVIDEVHNLRAKTNVLDIEEKSSYLTNLLSEALTNIINSPRLKLFKNQLKKSKKLSLDDFYQMILRFDYTIQLADIEVLYSKFKKNDEDFVDTLLINSYLNKIINIDIYKQFWRLCHVPDNIKVLLLSGTPMKDQSNEIASIMNLLLPVENQLPMGSNFTSQYLLLEEDGSYSVHPDKIDYLKQLFKNKISYLKSVESDVKRIFVGDIPDSFNSFVIDIDTMGEFQSKHYDIAYQKDISNEEDVYNESTRFYENSTQASLFVFPDGSYGKDGFNKYIIQRNKKYYLSEELKSTLIGRNQKETLNNLAIYSSKYADSISILLKNYEEGRNSFVYSEFVTGSGLILFSLILELFGFVSGNKNVKNAQPRYLLLSDINYTYGQILDNVQRFNQPDNMNGRYISIILGSRLISEGFTFKNIQSEIVLTPYWNYSETSQVIARGYRFGSHEHLIKEGIIPVLYIHQKASKSLNPTFQSIDLLKYKRSEIKDFSIKRIEQLMKESAFDCALNYDRNFKPGNDFQRDCNYQLCEYKCDGIDNEQLLLPTDIIDYSTFNLFYSSENVDNIIEGIKTIFQTNFIVDLNFLLITFDDYNLFEILSAVYNIITKNVVIINKYGFVSYLNEENNTFFLTNALGAYGNYLSTYYTENPTIYNNITFNEILNSLYIETLPLLIQSYEDTLDDKTLISYILSKISTSNQEFLFEQAKLSKIQNTLNCNKDAVDVIINYFTLNDFEFDGVLVNNIRYNETNTLRCLITDKWDNCNKIDTEKYLKLISKGKKIESPYEYIGVINPTSNDFCIKKIEKDDDLDPRKKTPGKVCSSYDRNFLVYLTILFNIPFPELNADTKKYYNKVKTKIDLEKSSRSDFLVFLTNFLPTNTHEQLNSLSNEQLKTSILWSTVTKNFLCQYLRVFFETNNIVLTDINCGTSKKKRK